MYKNLLDSMIKNARRKRLLKRALSVLCVVVLLFTMHTLRRDANTLERVPMCGYGLEHIHTAECFDGDALVCGMVEHIHTDACFQESPVTLLEADGLDLETGDFGIETGELEIESDLPTYDGEIVDPDAVFSLNENDFELVLDDGGSGNLVSNDVEEAPLDYVLGEETMLSRIIEGLGLAFGLEEVVDVGIVEDGSTEKDLIGLEKVGDDYRIWARKSFDMVQLALIREGDVVVVRLLDGVAAPAEEPLSIGEIVPAEEVAPAGDVAPVGDVVPAVEAAPAEDDAPVVEAAPAEEIVATEDVAPVEDIAPVEDESPVGDVAPVEETLTEDGEEYVGDVVPVEAELPVVTEQTEADTHAEEEAAPAEVEQTEEVTDSDTEEQAGQLPVEASEEIDELTADGLTGEKIEEQSVEDSGKIDEPTVEELTEAQIEEQPTEASEETDEPTVNELTEEQREEEAEESETSGEVEEQPAEASEENAEPMADEPTEGQSEEKAGEASEEQSEEIKAPEETEDEAEQPTEASEETVEPAEDELTEEQSEEEAEAASEEAEETEEASETEASEEAEEQPTEASEETVEPAEDELTEEQSGEEAEAASEEAEETEEASETEASEEAEEQPAEASEETVEPAEDELTEEQSGEEAEAASEEAEETEEASETEASEEADEQPAEDGEEGAEAAEDEPIEEQSEENEELSEEQAEENAVETGEEETVEDTEGHEAGEEEIEDGEAAQDEPAADQPDYAATIDLAQVSEYPLSLNALLAQAVPAQEVAVEDAVETIEDAEQEVQIGEVVEEAAEAPAEAPVEAPAEAPTWTIEYDHALLSIEAAEDDHLVTPLQSFEATVITVDNGSRYALTLVNCALPEAEEEAPQPQIAYPAQNFEGHTTHMKVVVSAPEGAFPEGAAMAVADVEDEKTLTDIEDTVSEDFVEVKRVHAVDITFTDAEGNEIEPLAPISVVMTVDEIEQQQAAVVVHVDDAGETEVVESQSEAPAGETEVMVEMPAPDVQADEADGAEAGEAGEETSVGFEADSFSVYAVVVTETIETRYIDAAGETWNISVGYGPEAGIPAGATLQVQEVEGDYLAQTAELLKGRETITLARFFDITILDAEGNEVQPAQPVEVKATLAEQSDDNVKAVHFAKEGPELIEASQEEDAVSFDAAGFSVYGIVYTVDFHYAVNSQTFDYGIPGGDCASLRELLPALNIAADDPETEENELETFMSGIADVRFTNPELVWVCPVTEDATVGALREALGLESQYSAALTEADRAAIDARALTAPDWALFSLAPFSTDEALTVAMDNGDSFTIAVTDAQIATRVLAADGVTYKINLTFGPEAGIPLDAELVAREIFSNDPDYIGYVISAASRLSEEGLNNVSDYRFFDIEIRKDGEKIEPAAPVQVNITYADAVELPEGAELSVVHFADQGIEVIRDVTLNEDKTTLCYEQASFSVSGTIVTGELTSIAKTDVDVMPGRYMLIAVVDGERYIILNDGTLKKVESFTDPTVEVDFPMAWMYMNADGGTIGDHIVHRADAVDYNRDKLASAFYWRYLDANVADGLSEDNSSNTLLKLVSVNDDQYYKVQENGRLIYPWTKIKYDPNEHTISNDTENGPTYYIGVAGSNGELHITGLNDREHAAEIYMAEITANTSEPNEKMQVGARYNTVNHIDIEVEGYANVTVPLRNGVYYYKDGDTVKSFEVTAQNPIGVKYAGKVPVTRDDIKTARVVSYIKNGNVDEVRDDMFYVAGYSANDATDLSTNQVRIEGVYKVADLSHVTLTNEQIDGLVGGQDVNEEEKARRKAELEQKKNGDTYNLDKLPAFLGDNGDGNGNSVVRELRLANKVYYSVSTEKLVEFDMTYEGKQLYASYSDAQNETDNKLKAQAMITLSASFDFWDTRNECPPLYWEGQYDNWQAGDIVVSVGKSNESGIGMDFELGDKNEGQTGTLSAQITKYIVDRAGNRIHPNAPTENTFHVYWNESIGDSNAVQGKNVGAYQNWDFNPTGYANIHDKRMTVGTEGTGTIYDYDVKPGMLYVEEVKDEDKLARQIVDQDGKTWKYVGTRLETEYVWRDDGCYGMNHVSKNYTTEDANYISDPEVLGNYYDVNGIGAFNGFVEYFVYNIYEPDVDIDVKKVWKHKNGTPADAPADASVTITLGRYKMVPNDDYVNGTLTIAQTITGGEANTPFQATYRLLKNGNLVKVGRYDGGNGGTTTITGIPAGEYTLEVVSRATGYSVENTIIDNPITISKDTPVRNVTVTSTLTQAQDGTIKDITVKCRNKDDQRIFCGPLNTKYKVGTQFKLVLNRRGPGHEKENEDEGLTIKINNERIRYDYRLDPDISIPEGGYTEDEINGLNSNQNRVNQVLICTVTENGINVKKADGSTLSLNGHTLDITHNWGEEDVKFSVIPIDESSEASEQSADGGTAVIDPAQEGETSGSDGDGAWPATDINGLVYAQDNTFSQELTLKNGVWETTLHNLPSMNEYGPYLYYIVEETCSPENIQIKSEIWQDGNNHVLTSSGETVLGVTNYRDNEAPSIHIRKVDMDGHPLAGASFRLYKNNESVGADISTAASGVCAFTGLADASYELEEITAPAWYKEMTGKIPFTVADGKIVFNKADVPEAVRSLVDFDEDTYTLTVKNEPNVEQNHIRVLKHWQDVKGDEMDPSETEVKVRLRRHKITERSKKLIVNVIVQNDPKAQIEKELTVVNKDSVKISWYDCGQFRCDFRRLKWFANDESITINNITRSDTSNKNAEFEIGNLNHTSQNEIEVNFVYKFEPDYTYIGWFIGEEVLQKPVSEGGGIKIVEQGSGLSPVNETSDDDNFSDEQILNSSNNWTFDWGIQGTVDDPENHTFAATAGDGISYEYYIEEIDMPPEYNVSYSENNANGVQEGLITVYNRRNTADVTIVKVDRNDETHKLAGATFQLRRLKADQKGLAYDEGFEPQTETTADSGEICFEKLPLGTYEIKETHLPDGYILTGDGAFYIRVSTDGVERIMKDVNLTPSEWQTVPSDDFVTFADFTATVRNTPGAKLPSTGGSGTTLYYALGSLMVLAAVALLIARRRGRV